MLAAKISFWFMVVGRRSRLGGVPALADFLRRHLFCRLRQESFILSHRHQKSTKQKIFGSGDEEESC